MNRGIATGLMEGCTSCDKLFDRIAADFKLKVTPAQEMWTQEYCVGLVELGSASGPCLVDAMVLNHVLGACDGEGRFTLVLYASQHHGPCLGIVHARRSSRRGDVRPRATWRRGEDRQCGYDHEALSDITRRVSSDGFVYQGIQGSNLGLIKSRDLSQHQVFDVTTWIEELIQLKKYDVRGIWCYVNSNTEDRQFALEVVTDLEELASGIGTRDVDDRTKFATSEETTTSTGHFWWTLFFFALVTSATVTWILSS